MDLTIQDIDRQIWQEELEDFIPIEIFDAHTHIYDACLKTSAMDNDKMSLTGIWADFPISNWKLLDAVDAALMPGRKVHRISFGNPLLDCSFDQTNEFVAHEVANDPDSIALMMVKPAISPEYLTTTAKKLNMRGLKPYRRYSLTGEIVECRISDYLPEAQIEAANELGMMVMLHLSKSRAIADSENLTDLERLTEKYPKIQWILAHCARSYYDRPLVIASERLKRINNLWFEISSVF